MSRKRKAESQLTPESADVESSVTHVDDNKGDTAEQIAARPPLKARRRGPTGPVNWDEMKEAAATTTTTATTTPSENATAPPAATTTTPATATESTVASESAKQPIIEPTEESATDQVKPVVQEVDEPAATSNQFDSTTTSDTPSEPAKAAQNSNTTSTSAATPTTSTATTSTTPSATTTASPFFKLPDSGSVNWSLTLAGGAPNPFSESTSSDLFKSNQPSSFSTISQDNGSFLKANSVIDFKLPINAPASISESKPKPIVEEEANLETGEEAENKLFSTTVKLFQLVTKEETGENREENKESAPPAKEWVERGTGELRFNVHKSDKSKSRVIVRTEKIHKLVINMFLFKNIVCNTVNDKSIRLVGFNLVEKDNPSPESYLLKFRNPADCSGLFKLIDEYKGYSPELKVNAEK